jgi:hypothetical protein
MASPRRSTERSSLKYLNSVYVTTIFTKLKRVLFDFASYGAIHLTVLHVMGPILYLNKFSSVALRAPLLTMPEMP